MAKLDAISSWADIDRDMRLTSDGDSDNEQPKPKA